MPALAFCVTPLELALSEAKWPQPHSRFRSAKRWRELRLRRRRTPGTPARRERTRARPRCLPPRRAETLFLEECQVSSRFRVPRRQRSRDFGRSTAITLAPISGRKSATRTRRPMLCSGYAPSRLAAAVGVEVRTVKERGCDREA